MAAADVEEGSRMTSLGATVAVQRRDDKRRKVLRAANVELLRAALVHTQASVASDCVHELVLCAVSNKWSSGCFI